MKEVLTTMRKRRSLIVGVVCIACFVYLCATSPRGELITQQFFDPIRVTDERDDVVIVGIDDASLQTYGAWPWNRSVFADLTKKLDAYGATVVVYDVLFLESRNGDASFTKTFSELHTPVILAAKVEKKASGDMYLESFYVNTTSTTPLAALANIQPDSDGKVRRYPTVYRKGDRLISPLAVEAYRVVTHSMSTVCVDYSSFTFRYPNHVTVYSLRDVMTGSVDASKLKDKIIFIGSTSLDLEDHFVGMGGEKVPGVYVHASILTSLLNNEHDRGLTDIEIVLSIVVCISFVLLLLHYTKTIIGQVGVVVLTILGVLTVSLFLFTLHILFPALWSIFLLFLVSGYTTLIRFIDEKKRGEHISSLFSKYVHKDVLRELLKSPKSLNLQGEKRELTILFSDLRGFTSLSESLSPEELTNILNGYFSAMTPSILDEHGTIDKFIGDAIMAFWNAPLLVPDHERHAVLSALSMQESLRRFNSNHGTNLAVGIGIHTGYAVVGNVGSLERVNYTVLGDTVNLASRVESLTKKYGVEIMVTEEVKNKVHDERVVFRKLDVITVKGKTEPTVLYEVMSADDMHSTYIHEYESALHEYQKGNFKKASGKFKILATNGDVPSGKMYERLCDLDDREQWDGVWHFDEK